jgi:MFS family permease
MSFPLLRPLRQAPFALLWGGLAIASTGSQLFAVVLSWVAVGLFGTAAGYLAALQAAGTLLTALLAGRWADQFEPRRVMIGSDLACAAMLLVVAAVWRARGAPPAWSLILCVLVIAIAQALFRPALQATVPGLARDPALLPAANALLDTTERIARLLGPGLVSLAGALLPLVHFVTINAATFAVSALAVTAIRWLRPEPMLAPAHHTRLLDAVLGGFPVVRRHPLLGFLLMRTGIINGAWYATFFLALPLLLERGGEGLSAYGLVISAYGVGNLAMTLVVGNRGKARRPARLIFGGNFVLGAGIIAMSLAGFLMPARLLLPACIATAAFAACGGPMQDITAATLRQTELPHADLAPAVRAFMVMNQLGALIALLAAPRLFDAIGIVPAMVLCGALIFAVAALGWLRFRT